MKKIMSTNYSSAAFNIATFVLRVAAGLLIFLNHGLPKINKFSEMQNSFPDPIHLGHKFSLICVIFAEVICSLLLVLGLFGRLAALILFIDMATAVFFVHMGQPIDKFEMALLNLCVFFTLTLVGPGKISVDGMSGK